MQNKKHNLSTYCKAMQRNLSCLKKRCVKNNQSLSTKTETKQAKSLRRQLILQDKRLAQIFPPLCERCDATKRNKSRIYPLPVIYLGFIKIAQNQQNGAMTTMDVQYLEREIISGDENGANLNFFTSGL